jgi:exopolysaccharide biosynthesis protein
MITKRLVLHLFLCLLLLSLVPAYALSESKFDLPLTISTGGYAPNPTAFSSDGYQDDSLTVKVEKRDLGGVYYHIVWVTVKSPTQLRTAVAGKPNQNSIARPIKMAKAMNAVFAINGEYYVQRTRDVFVYRQGEMYRNDADPKKDVLIIDDQGDFHIFTSENKAEEIQAYIKNGGVIVNAFSFGPALVVDGKVAQVRDDYYFDGKSRLPRSVIAQVGPLSYVFVEVYGPKKKCCTHQQMADFMGTLNVQNAYNLDGGQSSVMVFNGKFLDNKTSNTERPQSDIIYVASAVKP